MESTENKQIFVAPLDLADPASVTGLVEAWRGPLDILVNNAGIMAVPEQYTPQGWELHFATNHLGHFALANGLGRIDGWVHLGNIAAQARGPKPRSNSRAPWSASRK